MKNIVKPSLTSKTSSQKKIILLQKTIQELQTQLSYKDQELAQYYTILNKIYHSKLWRLLGIYKKLTSYIRNAIKTLIPISIRKKAKSYFEAHFRPSTIQSIVPPSVNKEWVNWNYNQKQDNSLDIINFSVIAWDFRFQRPQQIAKILGEKNHRVFYIKNEFLPYKGKLEAYAPIKVEKKAKNVYEVTLSASRDLFIYNDSPTGKDLQIITASIKNLINLAQISTPIAKIDHPFWSNIITQLSMPVVYDCMDNHQGFSDNGKHLANLEKKLFEKSNITIVSSKFLNKLAVANNCMNITVIPNAGDYNHFSPSLKDEQLIPIDIADIPHPIIGYYGALSDWFDTDILETTASQNPDKSFVLIGNVTNSKIVTLSNIYKNIHLLGEKSYAELPKYLKQFDVCTIPFILNDLIKATHPVKIFEYFAAGKPVVATKMPEIMEYKDSIFFANIDNFSSQINKALKSNKAKTLQKIAKENTWDKRANNLVSHVTKVLFPKVSIVLLSYNHADMVKNTIDSIMTRTFYPNYELIIVDNNSDQKTKDVLNNYRSFENINLIFNEENYGFAKGNNIGMKEATGDYIILLNNDVLLTPGWINRLLFHYQSDIGLIGPVTNSIGNEAKIDITYNPFEIKDLESKALKYTSSHWGETFELNNIAAFCWIMSKEIYQKIGDLDQRFGRGMFEDDDYCHRVKKAGYKILCAEDSYVHHFGGTSFKQIQSKEYRQLFSDNKKKFEEKWNITWQPHQYRK